MLKRLSLSAVTLAVTILAEITMMRPIAAQPTSPVVSGSDMDRSLCYMQTEDGKTLQLDNLCRSNSITPVTPAENKTPTTHTQQQNASTTAESNPLEAQSEVLCAPENSPDCVNSKLMK